MLHGIDLLILVGIHIFINNFAILDKDFLEKTQMKVPVVIWLLGKHFNKLEGLIKFLKVDEPEGVKVRLDHIFEFLRETCYLEDVPSWQESREVHMGALRVLLKGLLYLMKCNVGFSKAMDHLPQIIAACRSLNLDQRLFRLKIMVLNHREYFE